MEHGSIHLSLASPFPLFCETFTLWFLVCIFDFYPLLASVYTLLPQGGQSEVLLPRGPVQREGLGVQVVMPCRSAPECRARAKCRDRACVCHSEQHLAQHAAMTQATCAWCSASARPGRTAARHRSANPMVAGKLG